MKHRSSGAQGAEGFPLPAPLTFFLDRERKRFLAFARNDDARRRHTPSFPRKEVPRRGGGWLPQRDEVKCETARLSFRHPERSRGIFTPWRCTARMREREKRLGAAPHLTLVA